MNNDVLIDVQGVSKKYCRGLKQSLWYGMKDVASHCLGRPVTPKLRPGEFWANRDISFQVRRGDCLGLIGANGAGKSTLLKQLNGLMMPDKGTVQIRGRVGALIELGAGFNPVLTGRENIWVNGAILGMKGWEISKQFDDIIDFAGIAGAIDSPVQSYSSGMRVRLGFAVAATMKPDILLIDEVLAVGDAQFRAQCFRRLEEMQAQGTSFIIVSHNEMDIFRLARRCLLLQGGAVAFDGDTQDAFTRFQASLLPADNRHVIACSEARSGEDFSIVLSLPERTTPTNIQLQIFGTSGILGTFAQSAVRLSGKPIRVRLPRLPLMTGAYQLKLYAWDTLNNDFVYAESYNFSVNGPDLGVYGRGSFHHVFFDPQWTA